MLRLSLLSLLIGCVVVVVVANHAGSPCCNNIESNIVANLTTGNIVGNVVNLVHDAPSKRC